MTVPAAQTVVELGTRSGRLAPAGWVPPDGAWAFVLGSDAPGVVRAVGAGDFFEVYQHLDLTTGSPSYVRVRARVRPGAAVAGAHWALVLRVDENGSGDTDRVVYELSAPHDRPAELVDLAIPLRGVVAGTLSYVAFRLELIGTPDETYEVELPGVYLDAALVATEETRPTLINAFPSAGQREVRVDSWIELELSDPSASAAFGGNIDMAGGGGAEPTRIYVGGVLALEGLTFQTGFDGVESAITSVDGGRTTRIRIHPTEALEPDVEIPVRVETRARTQDPRVFEYAFRTEDLVAPRLANAVATDRRALLVQLTEDVTAADASGVNDALNPANWAVLLESTSLDDGLPAFTPSVVSVSLVSSFEVLLELDGELTPWARYRVTALNVTDLAGNQVVAPNNAAIFAGYALPEVPGRDFDIWEMLPQLNRDEDETRDLERFVKCLQEVASHLLTDSDQWTDILDPDVAPERFVDAMLADLGNPFPFALDDIGKRRLVRVLVPIYRQKGTDPGIINAVRFFLGLEVTISVPAFDGGWELGGGELGADTVLGSSDLATRLSFWIVSGVVLTADQRRMMLRIANYMRRAEAHLLGILEPEAPPTEPDHWELGLSELGVETLLH